MSNLPPPIENTNIVSKRHAVTLREGSPDPDKIREINTDYFERMRRSLGFKESGVAHLPLIEDIPEGVGIISVPLGVHRQSNSIYAGAERSINIFPGRMTMSEEDAEIAKKWALEQVRHYPTERNYAHRFGGVHSLVVRVEWGADPTKPYEVDTEPSGYGLFPHFSPKIRDVAIQHKQDLGNVLWATMPESRVLDSFEHASNPLALIGEIDTLPSEESGIILPFMAAREDLPAAWASQSVLPVAHMEDKSHLIAMGLFEELKAEDDAAQQRLIAEIESGIPKVIRGLVGSCAVGLAIYKGANGTKLKVNGKDLQGTITKTKFLGILQNYRERGDSVIVRDFAPATTLADLGITFSEADQQTFGEPGHMCAIKRYFVVFDKDGNPHILGGAISARKSTALIHGANDAVNIIVDPPMSEVYAK